MSDSVVKTSLFFHMGPGMNADPERKILSDTSPEIEFWDQPEVTGENAFQDLVIAAVAKTESLSAKGKISLIGHSFGGHIAAEVIRRRPELVASLTLISAGHDIAAGFHRLLYRLSQYEKTTSSVKKTMQEFLSAHPVASNDTLWNGVALIQQVPAFMRLYWTDEELYRRHTRHVENGPPFLVKTFHVSLFG